MLGVRTSLFNDQGQIVWKLLLLIDKEDVLSSQPSDTQAGNFEIVLRIGKTVSVQQAVILI